MTDENVPEVSTPSEVSAECVNHRFTRYIHRDQTDIPTTPTSSNTPVQEGVVARTGAARLRRRNSGSGLARWDRDYNSSSAASSSSNNEERADVSDEFRRPKQLVDSDAFFSNDQYGDPVYNAIYRKNVASRPKRNDHWADDYAVSPGYSDTGRHEYLDRSSEERPPIVDVNQISSYARRPNRAATTYRDNDRLQLPNRSNDPPGMRRQYATGSNIGGAPGLSRGGAPGLSRGGAPGLSRGGAPGLSRGGAPGLTRGGAPGLSRGGAPGLTRGGAPGSNRGGPPGLTRGNTTGSNRGNTTGSNRGNTTGSNRGNDPGSNRRKSPNSFYDRRDGRSVRGGKKKRTPCAAYTDKVFQCGQGKQQVGSDWNTADWKKEDWRSAGLRHEGKYPTRSQRRTLQYYAKNNKTHWADGVAPVADETRPKYGAVPSDNTDDDEKEAPTYCRVSPRRNTDVVNRIVRFTLNANARADKSSRHAPKPVAVTSPIDNNMYALLSLADSRSSEEDVSGNSSKGEISIQEMETPLTENNDLLSGSGSSSCEEEVSESKEEMNILEMETPACKENICKVNGDTPSREETSVNDENARGLSNNNSNGVGPLEEIEIDSILEEGKSVIDRELEEDISIGEIESLTDEANSLNSLTIDNEMPTIKYTLPTSGDMSDSESTEGEEYDEFNSTMEEVIPTTEEDTPIRDNITSKIEGDAPTMDAITLAMAEYKTSILDSRERKVNMSKSEPDMPIPGTVNRYECTEYRYEPVDTKRVGKPPPRSKEHVVRRKTPHQFDSNYLKYSVPDFDDARRGETQLSDEFFRRRPLAGKPGWNTDKDATTKGGRGGGGYLEQEGVYGTWSRTSRISRGKNFPLADVFLNGLENRTTVE